MFAFFLCFIFFFFNDTATTEIYTLSLHDALPISVTRHPQGGLCCRHPARPPRPLHARPPRHRPHAAGERRGAPGAGTERSEEHTSELQSRQYLVCRLLLEKKKKTK